MDRTGIDQISRNFSDEGKEVCNALDYRTEAFNSDLVFLSCLGGDLYNNGEELKWKLERGYITKEGMQTAMDSLKKLPEIPYVLLIINKMRELLARLGINEVVIETPTEPKIKDRLVVRFEGGKMTVDISDVKDGYVFFHVMKNKKTSISNIKFTRNLQMGCGTSFSVGPGWMIMDDGKIEDVKE